MKTDLVARGYHTKIIDSAFTKVRAISRKEALKKVEKKVNEREVLSIQYHPGLPSVSKVIRKHWTVMSDNPFLRSALPEPSMVAYKRGQNLGDKLFRAKVSSKRRSGRVQKGFKACQEGCQTCWHCKKATFHCNTRTGQKWRINHKIDCNTTNVIYKLTCKHKNCKHFVYIGETKRRLKDRFREHRGSIRNKLDSAIGNHFNLPGHSIADLVVEGIEKVISKDPKRIEELRKIRESYWINKYDAVRYGANVRD